MYVDGRVVTRDDLEEMKALQRYLLSGFEIKDLEQLKYFLRIKFVRSKKGISLSQMKYVLDLLAETIIFDCKPIKTPIVNHKLGIFSDQVSTHKSFNIYLGD